MGNFQLQHLSFAMVFANIVFTGMILLVWSLLYFSVQFFDKSQAIRIESLIWEAAVKDFELKTLKSQLNPHFIFNALNSIRALIDENPPKAQTAITQLSNILRYSLRTERIETVALEEEIKTIEDYLALEQIRFEERLKTSIETTPEAGKVEIPPLMVQTLVENGIKHGISTKAKGGFVSIAAFVINNNLTIQIRNTGAFDEDKFKESTGFGIQNTKQRLNLLYGEKGIFNIKNEQEDIVLAELIIPNGGTIR